MEPMAVIERRAYAKLNLVLSVGPPEPAGGPNAGFHPIASWMHAVDLRDDVRVERLPEGHASEYHVGWAADAPRPTPIDWPIQTDLGVRAHRALEGAAGRALPIRLTVRKRVPVGGGMGGGSSDAAAVLRAVRDLFDLPLTTHGLVELGRGLGSDVAFFLDDGPADPPRPGLVTGFGDQIERLDRIESGVVLVIPPFGCATGAVYRAFDEVLAERARERSAAWEGEAAAREARGESRGRPPLPHAVRPDLVRRRAARVGDTHADALFNDLAAGAYRVEPRLGRLVTGLSSACRTKAHVTGSGSGVFLLTDRVEKVAAQATRAAAELPGTAVVPTRLA